MPNYIGDVEVTLRYTIRDLELEAKDDEDAERKFKIAGENHDFDEVVNCGDWEYEPSFEVVEDQDPK